MASHIVDIHAELVRWLKKDKEGMIARLSRWLVHNPDTGCMEWVGIKNNAGYGYLTVRRGGYSYKMYAHRLFLVLQLKRNIRPGHEADHTCRNRSCVRHLQEVSSSENKRLMNERKKQGKSATGH